MTSALRPRALLSCAAVTGCDASQHSPGILPPRPVSISTLTNTLGEKGTHPRNPRESYGSARAEPCRRMRIRVILAAGKSPTIPAAFGAAAASAFAPSPGRIGKDVRSRMIPSLPFASFPKCVCFPSRRSLTLSHIIFALMPSLYARLTEALLMGTFPRSPFPFAKPQLRLFLSRRKLQKNT